MISFIVPAFNEERNIQPTVETIRAAAIENDLQGYEIIVIDDGSTDGTGAIIEGLGERIPELSNIRHPANLGIGSAIRSGIAMARCAKFMVIPGDNDVHRDLVDLMLTSRDSADLILTCPLNRELRSLGRITLSLVYQLIHMMVFRVFVNYINGPGIWPTERARAVGLRAKRFSIISEINVKLLRSGCSFAEVPGYMQRAAGHRKTVTLRNLTEVVRTFLILIYEVHIGSRSRFTGRPSRVLIEFASHRGAPPAGGSSLQSKSALS